MHGIKLGNTTIQQNGSEVYFIAEIGQNHQGDMAIAKRMIVEAKKCGCNCVKFQKSCLNSKFTSAALMRPYIGINSWGKTYGEHKSYLEFNLAQYRELQVFCKKVSIDFAASAMDITSLEQLNSLDVSFIKIGSGDANNLPLLEKAAILGKPLVISTGMQTAVTIARIVDIMHRANNNNYGLLHCVSSYPTQTQDCQLWRIRYLKQMYPHLVIGYSGHELGVEISNAAVLLGARIIERHFTMDKSLKGSDHPCSLLPIEMAELIVKAKTLLSDKYLCNEELTVREIVTILKDKSDVKNAMIHCYRNKPILLCEQACRNKLGKSLVAAKSMAAGYILRFEDIWVKVSEPNGISAEYIMQIIGCKLVENIKVDKPILWNYITHDRI